MNFSQRFRDHAHPFDRLIFRNKTLPSNQIKQCFPLNEIHHQTRNQNIPRRRTAIIQLRLIKNIPNLDQMLIRRQRLQRSDFFPKLFHKLRILLIPRKQIITWCLNYHLPTRLHQRRPIRNPKSPLTEFSLDSILSTLQCRSLCPNHNCSTLNLI